LPKGWQIKNITSCGGDFQKTLILAKGKLRTIGKRVKQNKDDEKGK
jgi:hypothetical protein